MADIKLKVTTSKEYSCKLSREDLVQALNPGLAYQIPSDAKITITVPTGGDYSGDCLDLDEVGGLTLTWREVKTS